MLKVSAHCRPKAPGLTFVGGIKIAALFAGVIVAAVSLGLLIASNLNDRHRQRARNEMTSDVLAGMNTVKVGDLLPDHVFTDLQGTPVSLSEIVGDGAILCVVDPTCESCVQELELIRDLVPDHDDQRRFLVITPHDPGALLDLQTRLGLASYFLWDRGRAFGASIKISTYPFNIIIDKSLRIKSLTVGGLTVDQIEHFLEIQN